jgi:putative peptidoglycan lipid II flippase
MAVGILIGGFLECAIQLPFVLKEGQRFFFTGIKKAFFNEGTRKVLILIGPTILGMAAYQINDLVSTALAGNAGEGVVSSLQYSLRMQELLLGIFAVSIGTVLLPDLTEHAKSLNWDIFTERLISALNIIAFITIPITFFSIARGGSLIRLLFENRSFNEESVNLTLMAFRFHMPGLYFIALNRILAPAFYAQSNSKSPTLAGLISFGINIAAASILVGPFKGGGIAFALSLASFVNTVFLLVFLKKNPEIDIAKVLKAAVWYSIKLILFSAIVVIPILFLGDHFEALFRGHGRIISLGLPILLLAILYAILGITLLLVCGDKQVQSMIRIIFKKSS